MFCAVIDHLHSLDSCFQPLVRLVVVPSFGSFERKVSVSYFPVMFSNYRSQWLWGIHHPHSRWSLQTLHKLEVGHYDPLDTWVNPTVEHCQSYEKFRKVPKMTWQSCGWDNGNTANRIRLEQTKHLGIIPWIIQWQWSFKPETTMHKCNKQEKLCQSTFFSSTQRRLVLEDYHFQTQMAFITQRAWCIDPGARNLVLHWFPKKDDTQSKKLKVILHGLFWSMVVA